MKKQSGVLFFAAGKLGECARRAKRKQAAAEAENPSGRTKEKKASWPFSLWSIVQHESDRFPYFQSLQSVAENKGENRMNSEEGIERFLEAQENDYPIALAEIQSGQKQSHWIWYIFPQLAHTSGFPNQSANNRYYGIKGIAEARVYWANNTLRSRLVEITTAALQSGQRNPEILMGSSVDARKLRSCMTLFAAVAPEEPIFTEVLDTLYGGQRCEWSTKQLQEDLA